VIIVADAGPLIALAKLYALGVLLQLYSHDLTTPAVYEEATSSASPPSASKNSHP